MVDQRGGHGDGSGRESGVGKSRGARALTAAVVVMSALTAGCSPAGGGHDRRGGAPAAPAAADSVPQSGAGTNSVPSGDRVHICSRGNPIDVCRTFLVRYDKRRHFVRPMVASPVFGPMNGKRLVDENKRRGAYYAAIAGFPRSGYTLTTSATFSEGWDGATCSLRIDFSVDSNGRYRYTWHLPCGPVDPEVQALWDEWAPR